MALAVTWMIFAPRFANAQQPKSSGSASPSAQASHPAPAKPPSPFIVILDPAHGGADNGAMLSTGSPEKNYTLSLAVRLHVLLNARGIPSILTRDSDTNIDSDARAEAANRAHAAACILLHATATGTGVHLFTSSLPVIGQKPPQNPNGAFLPWATAQAAYGTASLRLESDLSTALTDQQIPVLLERTSMMPLNSMACPAVAVEIAPLHPGASLSDLAYQEKIAQSLASGLVAWRHDQNLQP